MGTKMAIGGLSGCPVVYLLFKASVTTLEIVVFPEDSQSQSGTSMCKVSGTGDIYRSPGYHQSQSLSHL